MPRVHIIFGSTSGNTELVSEKVAEVLCGRGHETTLQRAENAKAGDLRAGEVTILAASTYGHGILQEDFGHYLDEVGTQNLAGRKYAVIGLGDPRYDREYHIESAKLLEAFITSCGGELIAPALRISRSPVPHLETRVKDWAMKLDSILQP